MPLLLMFGVLKSDLGLGLPPYEALVRYWVGLGVGDDIVVVESEGATSTLM